MRPGTSRVSNTEGAGFDTKRISAEQSGKWQARLSDDQIAVARGLLSQFPIADRYPDLTR